VAERGIFSNLSPLDHRYSVSEPSLFAALQEHLSEESAVRACLRVEAALLCALLSRQEGLSEKPRLIAAAREAAAAVTPDEVYAEEERTRHNIRALVNVYKARLPEAARPYVHLGATSVDILDTAAAVRYREVTRRVLLPLLLGLETELVRLARQEARTPQIGRTHGQHAVPITFGYAMAEYVSRLGKSIQRISARAGDLRGKLSGAVGAYNASSLLVPDPEGLEREFLSGLALLPSEHSTQLVEPEHLLLLLTEINTAFGIIANLADDLRNLQRSEIAEVREEFADTQVGSSTMPQKRNPWNSEHVKSLWKAFSPRVVSFFMDQISEHQRDLTNSASSRFVADYLSGFALAVSRSTSVLRSLVIDRERMARNIALTGDMVFSEALYVLIATAGVSDAHERVRKATLRAEKSGLRLRDVLKEDPGLWQAVDGRLRALGEEGADAFLGDPARYTGRAAPRALLLADRYAAVVEQLHKEIQQ
jgi:adenylosuccinate lyase